MSRDRLALCVLMAAVLPLSTYAAETVRQKLIQREIALEDAGDLVGAIEINKQILRLNPNDAAAMNVIAGLYGQLGKFKDEIIWARKAIASDPKLSRAYVNYGNAEFYLGNVAEARAAFEKAQKLAPQDPLPVYSLGVLEEEAQQLNKAIALYEKSVAIAPTFEAGLFNLGAMYANAKRYDEAIATLDRLLLLNPGATDARTMRQDIDREKRRVTP